MLYKYNCANIGGITTFCIQETIMAGMFYSLQQTIEKLGKTEAEIKTLVREGKLREFRDGAKQLYKTEDVDALASVPKGDTAILDDSMQLAIDETG